LPPKQLKSLGAAPCASSTATCKMIVSDNGTELTSNAVLAWCGEIGVEWHYMVFAGQKARRGIELQRRQFHRAAAIR
jgi:hypothetical protein